MGKKIELNAGPRAFFRLEDLGKFEDSSNCRGRLTLRSGNLGCDDREFYFDDLNIFGQDLKKLYESLTGVATLRDRYEPEFIKLEAKNRGHIEVTGEIIDHASASQHLKFSFAIDQTFLPGLIESVDAAINGLANG